MKLSDLKGNYTVEGEQPMKLSQLPQGSYEVEAEEKPMISGKGLLRAGVESLPMIGAVGGGLLGAALGPVGAIGGAGLGAGAGKGLQNIAEGFLYDKKPESTGQMYGDIGKEMAMGSAGEGAGQVLSKGLLGAAKMLPGRSANAPQIEKAAARLGVEPTPAMVSAPDDYFIKSLENDLAKSPTIGGALTRSKTEPVYSKIDEMTQGLLKDASSLSKYEGGTQIKKDIIADISERAQPIQMAYADAGSATKDIPLSPKSQARVAGNIRKIEGSQLFPEYKAASETYAQAIENAKSAKDLKTIATRAKETLRDPSISNVEKNIASEALDKISRLENNTIMREAIAQARTKGEGKIIGKDIVGNLRTASKEYKKMMTDIGTLAKGSKITKGKYGVQNVLREIDEVPAEKMPDMIFKTNDNEFLNFLKDKHPNAYAEAKKQKIYDIFKKSTSPQNDQISSRRFLQAIKDLGPEARVHLFGDAVNSIDDVNALVKSMPEILNPSGTARSMQIKQTFNPMTQGEDIARYGLYKTLNKSKSLKPKLQNLGTSGAPEAAAKGLLMRPENE